MSFRLSSGPVYVCPGQTVLLALEAKLGPLSADDTQLEAKEQGG